MFHALEPLFGEGPSFSTTAKIKILLKYSVYFSGCWVTLAVCQQAVAEQFDVVIISV